MRNDTTISPVSLTILNRTIHPIRWHTLVSSTPTLSSRDVLHGTLGSQPGPHKALPKRPRRCRSRARAAWPFSAISTTSSRNPLSLQAFRLPPSPSCRQRREDVPVTVVYFRRFKRGRHTQAGPHRGSAPAGPWVDGVFLAERRTERQRKHLPTILEAHHHSGERDAAVAECRRAGTHPWSSQCHSEGIHFRRQLHQVS